MATYYEHKAKKSREVPYSFQCEHCMRDSGPLTATIFGNEATVNSNHKTAKENEKAKLDREAQKNLEHQIRKEYKTATEKQVYSTAFKSECPHCKQPQSWAIAGMQKDARTIPLVLLAVGALVAVGTYVTQGQNLTLTLLFGGGFALAAAGYYFYNAARIGGKKAKTETAKEKKLPTIDWSAVRDILNQDA